MEGGPRNMQGTLQNRLRRLLNATRAETHETAQDVKYEANNLSIVVISRTYKTSTHWAIAVVTDERSRQCCVFHVSDNHIAGLRALGWTAFVQDETLDRLCDYRGGVRIGLVGRDDLKRFEEVMCGNQLPHPPSEMWDCEDWALAAIEYLKSEGFMLATHGMDGSALIICLIKGNLHAQRLTEQHREGPIFVPLSSPDAGR